MVSISLTRFKEMPMPTTPTIARPPCPKSPGPRRRRRPEAQQPTLFATPPVRPEWIDLPEPIRRRLLQLLGQMLAGRTAGRGEVGDE
jgi:hypothetical protein